MPHDIQLAIYGGPWFEWAQVPCFLQSAVPLPGIDPVETCTGSEGTPLRRLWVDPNQWGAIQMRYMQ